MPSLLPESFRDMNKEQILFVRYFLNAAYSICMGSWHGHAWVTFGQTEEIQLEHRRTLHEERKTLYEEQRKTLNEEQRKTLHQEQRRTQHEQVGGH